MSEDKNRFPDIVPPILPKKGLVYQVFLKAKSNMININNRCTMFTNLCANIKRYLLIVNSKW